MHPKLIEIGNFYIPTYGFFVALGVILGVWLTLKLASKEGFDKKQVDEIGNLAIYSILGGLLGSKLLLIIVDFKYYIQNPGDLIYVVRSGGVFYGGLIGGLITGIYFFKKYKLFAISLLVLSAIIISVSTPKLQAIILANLLAKYA